MRVTSPPKLLRSSKWNTGQARASTIGLQPAAQYGNAIPPGLAIQDRLIDDRSRRGMAVAVFEDCLNIEHAHMRKTLIGPAQGMRRQNDIIQGEYGIAGIGR